MIRYLTAGESHGQALVGIVEGVPAGLPLSNVYINHQLKRRQLGYGRGGRMKIESDHVKILSGVRFGKTLGSPIALSINNKDWKNWMERMAVDQSDIEIEKIVIPRPGHVDYAGMLKYRFDDIRNVIERASARETAMRVACCSIMRKLLEEFEILIGSYVIRIGNVNSINKANMNVFKNSNDKRPHNPFELSEQADLSPLRMLDPGAERRAVELIKKTKKSGDSLGGVFEVSVSGLPVGLGSYVQHDRKLDGLLAQALMSIHAVKGVEIGMGFRTAQLPGSKVHDGFGIKQGKIIRISNNAGGLEGGITNGEYLILRVAMKPISTLAKGLPSVDLSKKEVVVARYERSDVCAVPACSVIGEAVVAPVLANAFLEKFGGDSIEEIRHRYGSEKL
ncbi:MAG: chorismate synthase [bacterium]